MNEMLCHVIVTIQIYQNRRLSLYLNRFLSLMNTPKVPHSDCGYQVFAQVDTWNMT